MLFELYTSLLINFFVFLTLDLFINSFAHCRSQKQQAILRIIFSCILFVIAIVPEIPHYTILMLLFDLGYTLLICEEKLLTCLKIYVKYELYYFLCSASIVIIHSVLAWDITLYNNSPLYVSYTNITANFMLYVILSMYIILKKLSAFPAGKIYKRYFLVLAALCTFLLTLSSMMLGDTRIKQEQVLPLIFSTLLFVTLLCMAVFKKVLSILQENAMTKVELEKNALSQDYFSRIQQNLKELSILRHDFKNHLTVLHGYAASGRISEFEHYMNRLTDELSSHTLIATPSGILSAILNAKNEECKQKNIVFTFEQRVTNIYIDDFHLISIFSNMLDNAIAAAVKCDCGTICLRLTTVDSYLDIDCTNNHKENIICKDDYFLTTKEENKDFHGYGIQSIRRAVKELRGEITIDYTVDSFHVNIMVPNYR